MLGPYRSILGLTTEATEVHREKDNDNSKLSSLPISDSPLCSSVFSVVHLLLVLVRPAAETEPLVRKQDAQCRTV